MNNHRPLSGKRKSIRLKGYDYRLPAAYFVSLVSFQRECLFGEVAKGKMKLNIVGEIVYSEWRKLEYQFHHLRTDAFIVMPDHFHGIIIIESVTPVGATRLIENEIKDRISIGVIQIEECHVGSPLRQKIVRPNGPQPGSLGAIIGQYKSRATKRIWALPGIDRRPIWQRNYYEHIIRDDQEFKLITQ